MRRAAKGATKRGATPSKGARGRSSRESTARTRTWSVSRRTKSSRRSVRSALLPALSRDDVELAIAAVARAGARRSSRAMARGGDRARRPARRRRVGGGPFSAGRGRGLLRHARASDRRGARLHVALAGRGGHERRALPRGVSRDARGRVRGAGRAAAVGDARERARRRGDGVRGVPAGRANPHPRPLSHKGRGEGRAWCSPLPQGRGGRGRCSPRAATRLGAAVAVGLHPAFVPYTAAVMTEGVAAALVAIAAASARGRGSRARWHPVGASPGSRSASRPSFGRSASLSRRSWGSSRPPRRPRGARVCARRRS